jgi:DNA replication protein DnaC
MTAIDHETLVAMLDRLKLTAIRDQLDGLLDEAARSKMTLREALGFFVQREIARRDERRISMASKIAQFPFVRELDGFEFDAQPSLDPGQIRELATCRWFAHGDPIPFVGGEMSISWHCSTVSVWRQTDILSVTGVAPHAGTHPLKKNLK